MRLCIILDCGWLGWRIFLSLSLLWPFTIPRQARSRTHAQPVSHNGGIDGSAQLTADSPPPVYLFNCLRRFINDLYTRRPCIRGLAISARASSSSYVRSLMDLTMIIAAAHLTRSRGHRVVNFSLRTDTDSSTGQLMSHVFLPPAWWEFNANNEGKNWLFSSYSKRWDSVYAVKK